MTEAAVNPDAARIACCPLPGCHWASFTAPGPAEHPGALASVFGPGVFSAVASAQRLQAAERDIRSHIESHPATEWATALAAARAQIRELEAR